MAAILALRRRFLLSLGMLADRRHALLSALQVRLAATAPCSQTVRVQRCFDTSLIKATSEPFVPECWPAAGAVCIKLFWVN